MPVRGAILTSRTSGQRYSVLSRLGMGGMGEVFRVLDLATGRELALKVLRGNGAGALLAAEFGLVSGLRHPAIVRVYDFGTLESGRAFYTMDLLSGRPIDQAIGDIGEAELQRLGAELCGALAYVHNRGILHGDLKPSNVWVTGSRPEDRRIHLLDFGLATVASGVTAARRAGTLAYMAPEVLRGRGADSRADLWSLGAVLYRVVTGRDPFAGDTPTRLVHSILKEHPVPPSEIDPRVDRRLEEVILRLLDKQPSLRYHSATEVAAELESIGSEDPTEVRDLPGSGLIGGAQLVGRDSVSRRLLDGWRDAEHGRGRLIFVTGEEGIGKSRLIEEVRTRAQLTGGLVLEARFQDTSDPVAPVAEMFRSLAALDARRGGEGERSEVELDEVLERISALGRQTGVSRNASEEIQQLVERFSERLAEAGERRAALLVFEDLHSAVPEVRDLVIAIGLGVREGAVLVCATYRSDDLLATSEGRTFSVKVDHLLAEPDVDRLQVDRLSRDETARLIDELLGPVKGIGDLVARIHVETDGNPLMVEEALRFLVDEGILRRRPGSWYLSVPPADLMGMDMSPPGGIRAAAARRLLHIDDDVREVLIGAAVLGESFTTEQVARLLRREPVEVAAAIHDAQRRVLVRRTAFGALSPFQFTQRGIAEALYQELGRAERVRLHARSAALLEEAAREGRTGLSDSICRHYLAAGDLWRAMWHGLQAARRFEAQLVPSSAVAVYQKLLVACGGAGPRCALSVWILSRISDLYLMLGRFEDALGAATEALRVLGETAADGPRGQKLRLQQQGRLHRRIAEALARLSQYSEARAAARRGAEILAGQEASREQLELAYTSAWCRMMQGEYSDAAGEAQRGAATASVARDELMQGRFELLVANVHWHRNEWKASVQAGQGALALFERLEQPRWVADAHLALGSAYRYMAEYRDSIWHYERARSLYRTLGMVAHAGKACNNLGIVYYLLGDWNNACQEWEAFVEVSARTGERHERVCLLNNLGVLYSGRGQFERAREVLSAGIELARRIGYNRIEAMLESNLGEVHFRCGKFDKATEAYDRCEVIARELDAADELVELERRRCELLVESGRTEGLGTRLDAALEQARRLEIRTEVASLLRLRARFHRMRRDLDRASEDVQEAALVAAEIGASAELGRILLEEAQVLWAEGEREEGWERLERAFSCFEQLDSVYDRDQAQKVKLGFEAQNSLGSVTPAVQMLVDFNRMLGNVLELDALLQGLIDVVMDMTKAERGFVIVYDGNHPVFKVTRGRDSSRRAPAADEVRVSRTVTEQVRASRASLCITNIEHAPQLSTMESVIDLGLRAVMCVPMTLKGRVIGVIYVDSGQIAEEGFAESLPILEALASQAAISIENARLYEEQRKRTDLIRTVAHELNSPLSAMVLYLQLIQEEGQLEPRIRSYVDTVAEQTERLRRMVSNILELANASRAASYSMGPVSLSDLITRCVLAQRPVSDAKQLAVEVRLADPSPDVLGDRDRLEQVITNLFGNAVKFTPPGGRIVIVADLVPAEPSDVEVSDDTELGPAVIGAGMPELASFERHLARDTMARISVIDDGPGIHPRDIKQIFKQYTRIPVGPEVSDQRSLGLGLGLSIAEEIVRRHGGRIWATSELGHGATIQFTLRVYRGR
jgi:signal transduction histidine kinase/tetratricopeptide (TPR) repeat protein